MRRELILQLKLGHVEPPYFARKYGVHILQHFRDQLQTLRADGYLAEASEAVVRLSREGLMRVDALLPRFFLQQHLGIRYT
jgi:oxygen-independent coproporphyrinogen-3 oxidase